MRTQNLIAPILVDFSSDEHRVWELLKPGIPNDTDIAQEWVRARRNGKKIGPVLENERTVVENGREYAVQHFTNAEAWQEHSTGICTWFNEYGSFTIDAPVVTIAQLSERLTALEQGNEPPASDEVSDQAG